MPDGVARRALFENLRGAHGADIRFVVLRLRHRRNPQLTDAAPGPVHEFQWSAANWIFANRAKERFVRLAVLLEQPVALWKRDHLQQVDEQPNDDDDARQDQNVLEIDRRK